MPCNSTQYSARQDVPCYSTQEYKDAPCNSTHEYKGETYLGRGGRHSLEC